MWIPVKLQLKNFKSFQDQEYVFKNGVAHLIQGINETDEDAKSNGSGKSSLREALNYVLDLSVFSDSNVDLINTNNGAKVMWVELTLKNKETELLIKRMTPLKGGSTLSIFINREDQADKFATVRDGNKFIIDLLGVSKEDLLNYFIISKEKFVSFFSSSDTKVKELIGRFSNYNKIDGVEDIVKQDAEKLNSILKSEQNSLSSLDGKIELLGEQLENEKSINVEAIKTQNINTLNEKIKAIEGLNANGENFIKIKKEANKEINSEILLIKGFLKEKESDFEKLGKIDYDKEFEELGVKKTKLLKISKEINESINVSQLTLRDFNIFKMEVETSIKGSIECPKCLHKFVPGSEINVEEALKTLPEVMSEIESINFQLKEADKKSKEATSNINLINELISEYQIKISNFNNLKLEMSKAINGFKTKLQFLSNQIENNNSLIERHLDGITSNNIRITDLMGLIKEEQEKVIQTKEREIKQKIEEINDLKIKKEEEIEAIKGNIFDIEQWIFRFKKFRSFLANESLEIIQGYSNLYLQKMNSNLSVQLEGYKTNKDGSIREKITPFILRNGVMEGSGNYKKFSGGERSKIDFAVIIALQSLINNSCFTGGFDMLWTDEITESLDSLGLENLVSSLDDLGKTCLVTSHVTHDKTHKNILTVKKTNGISHIILE